MLGLVDSVFPRAAAAADTILPRETPFGAVMEENRCDKDGWRVLCDHSTVVQQMTWDLGGRSTITIFALALGGSPGRFIAGVYLLVWQSPRQSRPLEACIDYGEPGGAPTTIVRKGSHCRHISGSRYLFDNPFERGATKETEAMHFETPRYFLFLPVLLG